MLKKSLFLFSILFQAYQMSAAALPALEEIEILFSAYEKQDLTIVQQIFTKYDDNPEALKIIASAHDHDQWTLLHYAAWNDNILLTTQLISLLDSLEASNILGRTALHIAAELNHDIIVEKLIAAGANYNAQDCIGNTPLHIAATNKSDTCLHLLLENGANPTLLNHAKETMLHRAILFQNIQGIYLLFSHKKKHPPALYINAQDHQERTALHLAVDEELPEICALLLMHGADPHLKDSSDQTALTLAIKEFDQYPSSKSNTINSILYAHTSPPHQTIPSFGALFNQRSSHDIQQILFTLQQQQRLYTLLSVFDQDGETALTSAIKYNFKTITEMLLHVGADPNMPNKKGNTPLIEAIKNSAVQIPSLAETLIKAGASINMRGTEGYAPIHIATLEANCTALKLLCDNNVDLNSRIYQGLTPLCLALHKKYHPIIYLLIHEGAALNAISFNKCTPLHIAVSSQSPLDTELLIEHDALLDIQNKDGNTPLHIAIINKNKIIINRLINAGANCNIKNNNGETAIEYAERNKLTDILELFSKAILHQETPEIIEQKEEILEDPTDSFYTSKPPCHADLRLVKRYLHHQDFSNITDLNGETMLHQAALSGNKNLVEKLIAARAYINAPDEQGNTPLHKAISSLNPRIIQILLNAGADPLLKNKAGQTAHEIACYCLSKRKLFIARDMNISTEKQKKYYIDSNKMQNIIIVLEDHIKKKYAQDQTILEKKIPILLVSHCNISNSVPLFNFSLTLHDNP